MHSTAPGPLRTLAGVGWVPSATRGLVALAFVIACAFVVDARLYHALVTEDGPIEWAQFAACAAAAWWFASAARRARDLAAGLFACGFAFVAGEEVAWGQRLLDLDVAVIQDRNSQGELTLHNVGGSLDVSWAAFAGLAAFGAVVPRLGRLRVRLAAVSPPPALLWWFAPAAAYAALRLALASPSYDLAKAGEYFELCVHAGYAATAWFACHDGRRPRRRGSRTASPPPATVPVFGGNPPVPADADGWDSETGGRTWDVGARP